MDRLKRWKGGAQLSARTVRSAFKITADVAGLGAGAALPGSVEEFEDGRVVNDLLEKHRPSESHRLPTVGAVRLPGVDFESSNCQNFLIEWDFTGASGDGDLPGTAYVKIPCKELSTRLFANSLGFWELESFFCRHVAQHIPIRVPRVYAAAWEGSRFVLLLENLHEIPGARLFLNRDMAEGTTPERAARILRGLARLHARFWGWSEAERESLLPSSFNTYTSSRSREVTRALNASALAPALRRAPDVLSARLAETYRRAIEKWDGLLEAWYQAPLTLVHGDSHLGNCFEYPDEKGLQMGMIDFQAVHWSQGMRDVQYFLINSMDPEILIAHEAELISVYCEELAQQGIKLAQDEAFEQYRAFSFQTLLVGVVPLGLGNLTERDSTVLAVTRRSAAAVERLDFRQWLEEQV